MPLKLAKLPISAIYSSPLERTMETAEPLAKLERTCPFRILPALTEINVGDWQGKIHPCFTSVRTMAGNPSEPAKFSFPHGESFSDKQDVIVAALNKVIRNAGSTISHCLCLPRGSDQAKPGIFPGFGLEQLPTYRHRPGICKFRIFFRFAGQTRSDKSGGRIPGGSAKTLIRD